MALFVNVWLERNSCDSLSLIVITSPKNEDSFLYAPASALIAFALTRVLSKL